MPSRVVLAVVLSLPAAEVRGAKPEVIMYGANWCGPCRAVRAFLTQNAVPFQYLDIDVEENRTHFWAAAGNRRGIPLLLIDGEKVRGANLAALRMILERKGMQLGAAPKPLPGEETYGGYPTSWWQAQFAALRKQVADSEKRIEQFEANAQTNYDRDVVLKKMKGDLKIVKGALDQLEIDASRVSLPRKHRAY